MTHINIIRINTVIMIFASIVMILSIIRILNDRLEIKRLNGEIVIYKTILLLHKKENAK